MPTCPHCIKAIPEWDAFVASYKGPVTLRRVDTTDTFSRKEIETLGIDAFPTFYYACAHGPGQLYTGPRTSEGFGAYLSGLD